MRPGDVEKLLKALFTGVYKSPVRSPLLRPSPKQYAAVSPSTASTLVLSPPESASSSRRPSDASSITSVSSQSSVTGSTTVSKYEDAKSALLEGSSDVKLSLLLASASDLIVELAGTIHSQPDRRKEIKRVLEVAEHTATQLTSTNNKELKAFLSVYRRFIVASKVLSLLDEWGLHLKLNALNSFIALLASGDSQKIVTRLEDWFRRTINPNHKIALLLLQAEYIVAAFATVNKAEEQAVVVDKLTHMLKALEKVMHNAEAAPSFRLHAFDIFFQLVEKIDVLNEDAVSSGLLYFKLAYSTAKSFKEAYKDKLPPGLLIDFVYLNPEHFRRGILTTFKIGQVQGKTFFEILEGLVRKYTALLKPLTLFRATDHQTFTPADQVKRDAYIDELYVAMSLISRHATNPTEEQKLKTLKGEVIKHLKSLVLAHLKVLRTIYMPATLLKKSLLRELDVACYLLQKYVQNKEQRLLYIKLRDSILAEIEFTTPQGVATKRQADYDVSYHRQAIYIYAEDFKAAVRANDKFRNAKNVAGELLSLMKYVRGKWLESPAYSESLDERSFLDPHYPLARAKADDSRKLLLYHKELNALMQPYSTYIVLAIDHFSSVFLETRELPPAQSKYQEQMRLRSQIEILAYLQDLTELCRDARLNIDLSRLAPQDHQFETTEKTATAALANVQKWRASFLEKYAKRTGQRYRM